MTSASRCWGLVNAGPAGHRLDILDVELTRRGRLARRSLSATTLALH
jgi:hypothetical protein